MRYSSYDKELTQTVYSLRLSANMSCSILLMTGKGLMWTVIYLLLVLRDRDIILAVRDCDILLVLRGCDILLTVRDRDILLTGRGCDILPTVMDCGIILIVRH